MWGGHSCPPLLNLILAREKSESKAADKSVRPTSTGPERLSSDDVAGFLIAVLRVFPHLLRAVDDGSDMSPLRHQPLLVPISCPSSPKRLHPLLSRSLGSRSFISSAGKSWTQTWISAVNATTMANTAKIAWVTAMAVDSQVEYGTTPSYGSVTTRAASHSVAVTGLSGGTTYRFRVRSRMRAVRSSSGGLCSDHIDPNYDFAFTPKVLASRQNGTQQFTATVGNDSNHAVSWSATAGSVEFFAVIHCAQRLFKYTGHDHCDQPGGHQQDAVEKSRAREQVFQ